MTISLPKDLDQKGDVWEYFKDTPEIGDELINKTQVKYAHVNI